MKKILFFLMLIGALAQGQHIKIENDRFTFEKVQYKVQQDAQDGEYRFITCYYMKDGKPQRFMFISEADYNVFSLYDYQKNRWYDFDVIEAEKYRIHQKNNFKNK